MLIGVDEAGKGSVLGSLFVAAVAVPDPGVLPDAVDDSKTLTAGKRESLATQLEEADRIQTAVVEITADEIDDRGDMDSIVVSGHARAICKVLNGAPEGRAIVDAAGRSERKFRQLVCDRLDADIEVLAEFGADEEYDVVGAASIVAKSARDGHMSRLSGEMGTDLGSGYPSDEVTREFIRRSVESDANWPDFVRESWQTVTDIEGEVTQTGLDKFR